MSDQEKKLKDEELDEVSGGVTGLPRTPVHGTPEPKNATGEGSGISPDYTGGGSRRLE